MKSGLRSEFIQPHTNALRFKLHLTIILWLPVLLSAKRLEHHGIKPPGCHTGRQNLSSHFSVAS